MPSGITIKSVSNDNCTISGQNILCKIGEIEKKSEKTIVIKAIINKIGEFTNNASVTTKTKETNLDNNNDSVVVKSTLKEFSIGNYV